MNEPQQSSAYIWPPIARFVAAEQRLGTAAEAKGRWAAWAYEFLRFGIKQGWACLFGAIILTLIIATRLWYPVHAAVPRYDFLMLASVVVQVLLLLGRLETWQEAKIILLFHAIAMGMEIFKVHMGSWLYPEQCYLRLAGVPLFAGFMYGSIGSYLARVWRLFDFRFTHHPPLWATSLLAIGIYGNFFAHHFFPDIRVVLFILTALLFGRTTVWFRVRHEYRRMPLLLGFFLVAFFIWIAENVGTAAGAWLYPAQAAAHHWSLVPMAKLGAWFLLMIISYVLVSAVNRPKDKFAK